MFNFINLLILVNGTVFLLWRFSTELGIFQAMMDNFLVSWTALAEGRYWVLLTSAFSHIMFFHFFINMYVLKNFGPIIYRTIGKIRFIRFYIAASIISSLTHALFSYYLVGDPHQQALGASGAIAGLILLFSFLYPEEKLLLLGIIPVRAIWGALIFIGLDVWGLIAQTRGGGLPIGHGAHLGGAFVGIIYYLKLKLQIRRRANKIF